ncbi:hypothetical protein EPN29_07775 [bacterium]|nr:MAG: hypothetical protein EPN29_07775 [bacterium]
MTTTASWAAGAAEQLALIAAQGGTASGLGKAAGVGVGPASGVGVEPGEAIGVELAGAEGDGLW